MSITNLTSEKIDEKFLRRIFLIAQKILKEKIDDLSLVLADDKKIREINRKYRRQDETTDVLSFEGLNEIFISLPQAKKQAKEQKIGLNCELTRLFVHGIVHLAGLNHEKGGKQAARMLTMENKILEKL